MERRAQCPDLLEALAELAGCDYLTDLRNPRFLPAVRGALEQIPAEAYAAAQWREAACYLSCPRLMNESAVKIRRGLLETTA